MAVVYQHGPSKEVIVLSFTYVRRLQADRHTQELGGLALFVTSHEAAGSFGGCDVFAAVGDTLIE